MNLALPTVVLAVSAAVWPLVPHPDVVNPFDRPDEAWSAGHRGVDLAGDAGQDVVAALPGTVTFAGRIAGKGVVVVDHGGRRTTYEPVDAVVRVGDTVTSGQRIGTLETAAGHCQPAACLHGGLIDGNGDSETYQDPLGLIDIGPKPIRLLPLDEDAG